MFIKAVDSYNDLFVVKHVVSQYLVDQILSTDWMNLPYQAQEGQTNWPRRKIQNTALPWYTVWEQELGQQLPNLEQVLQVKLNKSVETAFWLDESGFTCDIHHDGELPASMQLCWVGHSGLGTVFYDKDIGQSVRYQTIFEPNTGYLMLNLPDSAGSRHLQWHGMPEPVPPGTFRLTSYTWLYPVK